MALRRIDGHWHIDIRHNGRRIRRSTGLRLGQAESKRKAQELHDKIKHDLWSQAHLGTRPAHTWKQAVVKWIQENSQKKSLKDDKQRLRILDQWLADKQLSEIDKELVDKIKQERKLQRRTHYAGKNRARAVSRVCS